MALTFTRVQDEAAAIKALCKELVDLHHKVDKLVEHNSDQAIDWGAAQTPAYITEDASGNIEGTTFTRQQVANAIGSLAQFVALVNNGVASQGDHLGNLNVLRDPQ